MATILISLLWLGGKFLSLAARRTILQILCSDTDKKFIIDKTLRSADSYMHVLKSTTTEDNINGENTLKEEDSFVNIVKKTLTEENVKVSRSKSILNRTLLESMRDSVTNMHESEKDSELEDIRQKDAVVDETMQAIETALSRQEDIVSELEKILPKVEQLLPELEQKAKELNLNEPLKIPSLLKHETQKDRKCKESAKTANDKAVSQFDSSDLLLEICKNYPDCILTDKERVRLFQTLSMSFKHGSSSKTVEEILHEELMKCEKVYDVLKRKQKHEIKENSKGILVRAKNTEKAIQTRVRRKKINKCILNIKIANMDLEKQHSLLANKYFACSVPCRSYSSYMAPNSNEKSCCKSCPEFLPNSEHVRRSNQVFDAKNITARNKNKSAMQCVNTARLLEENRKAFDKLESTKNASTDNRNVKQTALKCLNNETVLEKNQNELDKLKSTEDECKERKTNAQEILHSRNSVNLLGEKQSVRCNADMSNSSGNKSQKNIQRQNSLKVLEEIENTYYKLKSTGDIRNQSRDKMQNQSGVKLLEGNQKPCKKYQSTEDICNKSENKMQTAIQCPNITRLLEENEAIFNKLEKRIEMLENSKPKEMDMKQEKNAEFFIVNTKDHNSEGSLKCTKQNEDTRLGVKNIRHTIANRKEVEKNTHNLADSFKYTKQNENNTKHIKSARSALITGKNDPKKSIENVTTDLKTAKKNESTARESKSLGPSIVNSKDLGKDRENLASNLKYTRQNENSARETKSLGYSITTGKDLGKGRENMTGSLNYTRQNESSVKQAKSVRSSFSTAKNDLEKSIENLTDGSLKLVFLKNSKLHKNTHQARLKASIINAKMDKELGDNANCFLETSSFKCINKQRLKKEILAKRPRKKVRVVAVNKVRLQDILKDVQQQLKDGGENVEEKVATLLKKRQEFKEQQSVCKASDNLQANVKFNKEETQNNGGRKSSSTVQNLQDFLAKTAANQGTTNTKSNNEAVKDDLNDVFNETNTEQLSDKTLQTAGENVDYKKEIAEKASDYVHVDVKRQPANHNLPTIQNLLKEYATILNKSAKTSGVKVLRKNTKNKTTVVSKPRNINKASLVSRKTTRKCFYFKQNVVYMARALEKHKIDNDNNDKESNPNLSNNSAQEAFDADKKCLEATIVDTHQREDTTATKENNIQQNSDMQENAEHRAILRQHLEVMQNNVPFNIKRPQRKSILPYITIWNQQPRIMIPKVKQISNSDKKSDKKSTPKKYQYKPKEYKCFGKTMRALYLVEDEK